MDHKKKTGALRTEGSFTVEAALIMPIILGIIVLFIYIAMYSYDRCVIEYVCQKTCILLAAGDLGDEAEAGAYAEGELRSRLAGNWETDIRVYSDESGTEAEIEAYSPVTGRTCTHACAAYKQFLPNY